MAAPIPAKVARKLGTSPKGRVGFDPRALRMVKR